MSFPKTGGPEWAGSQASPWTPVNEAHRRLDALASRAIVVDRDLTAPPGACADGANYLVKAAATGLWAGKDGKLATAVGANAANGWLFQTVAVEGYRLRLQDEDIEIEWDGAAWIPQILGESNYADLDDVSMGGLTGGDIPVWDDGIEKWVPVPLPGGGSGGTVPDGGIAGQVLGKASGIDQDTEWIEPARWKLIDTNGDPITSGTTATISGSVANIDVINLDRYSELMVIARNVTASVSGVRAVVVSVDGGSTYYASGGDYSAVTSAGVESTSSVILTHDTASSAARSLMGVIRNISAYGPKWGQAIGTGGNKDKLLVASFDPIDAIRFFTTGGNLTGGDLFVFAR